MSNNQSEQEFANFAPIEQLKMLFKQSAAAFFATIAVLLYILFYVSDLVDPQSLYIWTAAIIVLNIYLLVWSYFVYLAKTNNQITIIKAKRFINIYQLQALLHGSTWGFLPFLLIDLTTPEMKFFAYIVICGLAAGAIGTTAMIYRIYLSFMLPLMLPVMFTQLLFSDQFSLFGRTTLEMLFIFVISLIVLAHSHYDSIKTSISLMLENKRLLGNVTEAFEKAEAASEAKSYFLANMSHELRTPLNAVIGYSEIIYENAQDNDFKSIPKDAEKITQAGTHLLSLINNVLDLSKIESGKMDVFIENINLYHLLNNIKATTETLISENNNELIFNIEPTIGIIKSDHTKLSQILINIIGNAAKFTSEGKIEITGLALLTHIQLSITDTGIGMTQQQLDDLVTPFSQADASTTRKYGGTGLGMSLTDHLTKILGIEVDVKSAPDKGTSFELIIPLNYIPK